MQGPMPGTNYLVSQGKPAFRYEPIQTWPYIVTKTKVKECKLAIESSETVTNEIWFRCIFLEVPNGRLIRSGETRMVHFMGDFPIA